MMKNAIFGRRESYFTFYSVAIHLSTVKTMNKLWNPSNLVFINSRLKNGKYFLFTLFIFKTVSLDAKDLISKML